MVKENYKVTKSQRMRLSILLGVLVSSWLIFSSTFAQDWHNGEGLVTMANITPEQARSEALVIARQNALEEAGIEIRGVTARHIREASGGEAFDLFARFTRTVTRGRIISEEYLFDDQVKILNAWHYKVALRAEVAMEVGEPDPAFKIDLNLDPPTYRDGETMTMTLSATRDCWVTVLNLYADDSLRVTVPNKYMENNFVGRGCSIPIPPVDAGWELPVTLELDVDQETGAMLAVATKDDIPFISTALSDADSILAIGDALTAINKWLIDIPSNRRTEDMIHYKIVK